MTADAYTRRIEKLQDIIEAGEDVHGDVILTDGLNVASVTVRLGSPFSHIEATSGHHVFVQWMGDAKMYHPGWTEGMRVDHDMLVYVWWLTADYRALPNAELEFMILAANLQRIIQTNAALQLENYWRNLEVTKAVTGLFPYPLTNTSRPSQYWRLGMFEVHISFKEAV